MHTSLALWFHINIGHKSVASIADRLQDNQILEFHELEVGEVEMTMGELKPKKATSCDSIAPNVLKIGAKE